MKDQTPSRSVPSAIYVWLVPSEEVLEQPGSWRIRKWDTEPFPEANFVLSNRTVGLVVRDGRVVDTCGSSTQVQDGFYFLSLQEQADDELTMRLDHPKKEWAALSEKATIVHPQNHAEATQRIDECVREIEMIADAFGYDQYEWLAGGKGCA